MASHFDDPDTRSWDLPKSFAEDDVRLSEDVIERYVSRYTQPGDLVFDPFAGYGTTALVAERMDRIGLGYEIVPERAEYANSVLSVGEVRVGDIRDADLEGVTPNLVISSPPYMNRTDPEDPLQAYRTPVKGYDQYIAELSSIYVRLGGILTDDGRLVIQIQNLRNEHGVTPLAFDMVSSIGPRLEFLGEEVTIWQKDCFGYTHGYCLIYKCA